MHIMLTVSSPSQCCSIPSFQLSNRIQQRAGQETRGKHHNKAGIYLAMNPTSHRAQGAELGTSLVSPFTQKVSLARCDAIQGRMQQSKRA